MRSSEGRGAPSTACQTFVGAPACSRALGAMPKVSPASHRTSRMGSMADESRCYRRRMSASIDPHDMLDIDHLLSDDERAVRDTAREWVHGRILPAVEDWYEAGEFPARELAKELGEMGFLGMQLHGEGMLGLGPVGYGLVELELEAGDSGLRSFVSVQSALAMFAILTYGSDE